MYGVVGANTNSSYGQIYGPHSKYRLKSSYLLIAETEKQSTRLNCIVYPEEHNGTILLTYEAHIKQLATPPNYIGPNNYRNPRVNHVLSSVTLHGKNLRGYSRHVRIEELLKRSGGHVKAECNYFRNHSHFYGSRP